jgi:hypothetical protein
MPMYTFYLRTYLGGSTGLAAAELGSDAESLARAGRLLDEHRSCDHIDIWSGDRAVLARYRDQPLVRPVEAA